MDSSVWTALSTMNTRTSKYSTRWLVAVLWAGLIVASSSSAANFLQALPAQQAVTEGRSVSFVADVSAGSVQWEINVSGSGSVWAGIADDTVFHGATTKTLEIASASLALEGVAIRFISTVDGVSTPSNAVKLTVRPILFPMPSGMALDGAGGLIVSDASNHTIRRIGNAQLFGWGNNVDCPVSNLAGNTGQAGSTDGAGTTATFNQPNGVTFAQGGEVVVADTANGTIRRINMGTRVVSTLAGSSTVRGNIDGATAEARFSMPVGVARNPDGSYYVTDSTNHTIRKVMADGSVTTFAGSPGNAGWMDGIGSAARFNNPTGIGVDTAGVVYVADTTNNLIRKITPGGMVSTLAGVPGVSGARDGAGDQAMLNGPTGLAVAPNGYSLFVADTGNSTIRLISFEGQVSTYAGVPTVGGLRDGTGYYYFNALLNQPKALVADGTGLLFIADTGNAAIRVISQYDGVMMTLPLVDALASLPSPAAQPTPTPAPSTPTPSASGSSPTPASGGGDFSGNFVLWVASLYVLKALGARGRVGSPLKA